MKVVLIKDLKGRGKKGDIISVNDGYASNYLIPNGYALVGNSTNVNEANQAKIASAYQAKVQLENARELAKKISGTELNLSIKCGENGKMFGSITNKEIETELRKLGFDIDKKKIEIENIKSIGLYTAVIKLHPSVFVEIKINVQGI